MGVANNYTSVVYRRAYPCTFIQLIVSTPVQLCAFMKNFSKIFFVLYTKYCEVLVMRCEVTLILLKFKKM